MYWAPSTIRTPREFCRFASIFRWTWQVSGLGTKMTSNKNTPRFSIFLEAFGEANRELHHVVVPSDETTTDKGSERSWLPWTELGWIHLHPGRCKEILKLNGCGGCYPEMSDLARCTETRWKSAGFDGEIWVSPFSFLENTYILMWSKLVHPMYNDMDIWQKIVLL